MATLEIKEMYERTATFDPLWRRHYTRTFWVVTDNPLDDQKTIALSADPNTGFKFPNIGDGYFIAATNVQDSGSFVQQVQMTCVSDDGCQWKVVVTYGPYDPKQEPANPMDRPLHITWGWAEYQKTIDIDINVKAIVNSCFQKFNPGLQVDDSRPLLHIQRNEATFEPAQAQRFRDAINTDQFFGGDPFTWKCKSITGELQFNQDQGWFYSLSYEFEYRVETWIIHQADNGLQEFDYGPGQEFIAGNPIIGMKPMYPRKLDGTINGPAVTEPEFLDGNGSQLPPQGTPVFLAFHVYPEVEFAELKLDPKGMPGQGTSE